MMVTHELPLISVVVPSYNQGQFLKHTLMSIFSQGYPKLEVIVMDGGSTDNSVEVIKSYESKIAYWQSQPDGGQAAAIDAGMRRSKGDLVTWLNSDDFYLKNAFKYIVKVYQENPEASFYAGNGFRVTESGMIKAPFYRSENIIFDRNALIYSVDYILQPCTFMNRKYLEQVNYLNHDLHYGMDWDLFIRLSAIAEPVLFFDFIAASREYANTKTSTGYFKRIEELRCIAQSHSGCDMTPGVVFYLLGDLMAFCRKNPDLYPKSYLLKLYELWKMNKNVLQETGLDTSGFIFSFNPPQKNQFSMRR